MVKNHIIKIKERIARVCFKNNRDTNSVTVIAITKGRSLQQISEIISAGIIDIGENRIQEAIPKYNELEARSSKLGVINWHMVGHLQTNKTTEAVRMFDLIHSVDSLRLAKEIDKAARKQNKIQDVLLQVNTSREKSKFGLGPEETTDAIVEAAAFKNINITGLMTIAPLNEDSEKARPYFSKLRELRDRINSLGAANCKLRTLSMGMTDDFEVAIEEGSTMLRLGRALFEG